MGGIRLKAIGWGERVNVEVGDRLWGRGFARVVIGCGADYTKMSIGLRTQRPPRLRTWV